MRAGGGERGIRGRGRWYFRSLLSTVCRQPKTHMTNLASILDLNPGWIEAYGVWDDAMHGFLTESLGWGTRASIEGKAPWQVFMLAGQTPGAGGGGGRTKNQAQDSFHFGPTRLFGSQMAAILGCSALGGIQVSLRERIQPQIK